MDGLAVAALCREWNREWSRARIEKIHQPGPRDVVLTLRSRTTTDRLLLSAHRAYPRAYLLGGQKLSNPTEPPMFCMLLRKRLEGGRILGFRQQGWDRAVEIAIENVDELGDRVVLILILEMMGKHSNLILCTALNEDGSDFPVADTVIDSIVHVTPDMSRVRPMLPGLEYTTAPPLHRVVPDELTAQDVLQFGLVEEIGKSSVRNLSSHVSGIGPVTAKEILGRALALNSGSTPDPKSDNWASRVASVTESLVRDVKTGGEQPSLGLNELGRPEAAAPFVLSSANDYRTTGSFNVALCEFYQDHAEQRQLSTMAMELEQVVANQLDRLRGKLAKLSELENDSELHEELRIKGELLTTYMAQVTKGDPFVILPNYYDDENPLRIDLDQALTPIENAQRYFKQASKRKRSIAILAAERESAENDLRYLEAVEVHLRDATQQDLEALRQELQEQGFVRALKRSGKRGHAQAKPKRQEPDAFMSTDGFVIRVGRNNQQNDRLTLRTSQPNDVWLHVKEQPGSHVVVQTQNREISETALEDAARLAVYFSKVRDSANVPVDYTLIKHIWKPNGARPGHVLYEHYKTLFVTADRRDVEPILTTKKAQD